MTAAPDPEAEEAARVAGQLAAAEAAAKAEKEFRDGAAARAAARAEREKELAAKEVKKKAPVFEGSVPDLMKMATPSEPAERLQYVAPTKKEKVPCFQF